MANKKIGGSIVLEGASKYNSDLKNIKTNLAQLRSEMKLCNSQYSNNANSTEALSKKHEILSKEMEQLGKRAKTYAEMIEETKKAQEEAGTAVDKYTMEVAEAKEKLKAMEQSGKATNEELEEQKSVLSSLEAELTKANSKYEDGEKKIKQYATAENNAEAELNDLNNELIQNDKYLDEANNSFNGCATSIDKYGNEVQEAGEKTSTFASIVKGALTAEAIAAGVKALANGVKEAAQYAIEVGSSFEAGMSKVAAISGATGADLEKLTAKAKEMGATTMFSATESADALSYMAMAGWKADQMLAGLPAIMNLAAASGEDLAMVSDIVTDDLTAFGMSAEEAGHFADVLAAASSNANTNVAMMGETFKYAGAIAGAMHYSIEDMAVATGLMANNGIKASNAGTSLRSIITRMAKPTKESAMAMKDLGIELEKSPGEMYTFMEMMEQLRDKFDGLTDAEKASYAAMLAGKTGMTGLLAIVNSSDDDFEKLCTAIDNSTGAAKQMADVMQNNLKGKITILHSALEGLGISVYEIFGEDLKEGVDAATDAVGRLQNSVENGDIGVSLNKMSDALGNLIENAVDLGEDALPVLIDAFTWIINNTGTIAGAMTGMLASKLVLEAVAAWKAFKTATEGATVAQWLFNAAANANPIGIMITALAIATGAAVGYSLTLEDAATKTADLQEKVEEGQKTIDETTKRYESQTESIKNLCDRVTELNEKEHLSIAEKNELYTAVAELNKQYPELGLQIDATTGKLQGNTEAIKDQMEAFKDSLDLQLKQKELELILEQLAEDELAYAEAQKIATEAANEAAEAVSYQGFKLRGKAQDAQEAADAIGQTIEEERQHYAELAAEVDNLTQAQDEAKDSAVSGMGEVADAMVELSEEQQKLLEKTQETVSSFDGLFDQMSTESRASLSEMNENLKTNAEGMNDYADNVHKAMNIAAESTDQSTKDIVNYLVGMGIDGAAELALFVQAAEEKSAEYNEIIQNFGDFQQAQYTAEQALADWNAGVNDGYEGIINTANTKHEELNKSQQDMFDTQMEQAEQYKEDATQMATDTQQSVAQATLDEQGTVETANETVAKAAIDKTASTLEINNGRSDVFYRTGTTIDDSLASGIDDGTSAVCSAVSRMCEAAVASVDISGITSRIDAAIAAGAERAQAVYGGG